MIPFPHFSLPTPAPAAALRNTTFLTGALVLGVLRVLGLTGAVLSFPAPSLPHAPLYYFFSLSQCEALHFVFPL